MIMRKKIQFFIIAVMLCCVTVINAQAVAINDNKIVASDVDRISGKYFYKNGHIYKISKTSKTKKIKKIKVKKMVAVDDLIIFLDNKKNLWAKGDAYNWFYYKAAPDYCKPFVRPAALSFFPDLW